MSLRFFSWAVKLIFVVLFAACHKETHRRSLLCDLVGSGKKIVFFFQ